MAQGNVIELNGENFEAEVLGSEVPVLVDFWAEWCGPCRMAGPIVDKLAEEYAGKIKVCKVNIDQERDVAVKAGVTSIPTLNFYKGGQLVDQMTGVTPSFESDIKAKIESQLGEGT